MAILLGSLTLPATLVWEDEFTWTPVAQSSDYSLTGALIVQTSTKLAGRPITLTGKSDGTYHTAGLSRADLLTLKTALDVTGATFTLTLHDARTFTVMAATDALQAEPLPIFRGFAPADPASDRWYLIRSLKLMTV